MTRRVHMTPRSPRWLSLIVWAIACTAAMIAAPFEARAGKLDETLDLSVHTRAGSSSGDIGLRSAGGPTLLGNPRLVGQAYSVAPTFRINISLAGFRFGIGAGFEGYRGLRLAHDALPAGYRVTDGRVGGIPIEGFVGYALPLNGHIRPFVEARTTATVMVARASLTHRDEDLGSVRMHGATFSVGGRAGVLVALSDYVFVDAGVGRVFHGPGGWTASVGIGLPIPLSNL